MPKQYPHIIVIGGGIAGLMSAYTLSLRGAKVTLLEKNSSLFSEASGNKRGIINPLLIHENSEHLSFLQAAYVEALSFYDKIPGGFHRVGALQYPHNNKVKKIIGDLESKTIDPDGVFGRVVAAKEYLPSASGKALFYPRSGYITQSKILSYILSQNLFTVQYNRDVLSYREHERGVVINTSDEEFNADYCIFANGYFAAKIFNLPLEAVRGEVVEINKTSLSSVLEIPICFNGYLVPLETDSLLLGSTYDHGNFEPMPLIEKQQSLVARLSKIFPVLPQSESLLPGRVSFRTSTPDKLPIIGPYYEGSRAILNVGHGSKGFQTAIIAGRIIAEYLFDSVKVPNTVQVERSFPDKKIMWKRYPWQ